MKSLAFVFIGGGAGSVLRYLATLAAQPFSAAFPFGTLAVNILGSFLIGLVAVWIERDMAFDGARHLLIIGLLGGFTTFSAFSFESVNLVRNADYLNAGSYIAASVILCLLAAAAGLWAGKMIAA